MGEEMITPDLPAERPPVLPNPIPRSTLGYPTDPDLADLLAEEEDDE